MPTLNLDDALNAIADGTPVAWDALERSTLDDAEREGLRLLDDVARAFREGSGDRIVDEREAHFRWGPLEVGECIGEGSYGEVYRAFDPWLERTVALKLQRTGALAALGSEHLDEARRLARVRHHNVVAVYGSAIHDGRAGLWSERLEGETLASLVARQGSLGVEETLRIGRDLARALAAIHAAGLVHGDVKAANVMREPNGRIVLMDFGAGGEERLIASRRRVVGTPAYLPPEVVAGAPLGIGSDIYALGALMFFLLTGRMPKSADAAGKPLASRQRLEALRPDIDARTAVPIEACIDPDPGKRPHTAADAARAFDDVLHRRRSGGARRLAMFGAIAGAAALIAIAASLSWSRLFPPAWNAQAGFVRAGASAVEAIASGAIVKAGERLRLDVTTNRPAWIYVLNEDADGIATVLFPLADGPENPLAPAAWRLPGASARPDLAWEIGDDSAREEFVVIASLQPRADIEQSIADWRKLAAATRSVGALSADAPAEIRGAHLKALLATLNDSSSLHVWKYEFPHDERRALSQ